MTRVSITAEEFFRWDLFAAFEHTAWRLESRDAYSSPVEDEMVRKYLAGEGDLAEMRTGHTNSSWSKLVRQAVTAGKRIERVRVVPDPLTNYQRWEAWLCQLNTEDGEDIRYLARDRASELGVPSRDHDYWLFDSRLLYLMHFDEHDRLQRLELIEDLDSIVRANFYRDAAWHYAIPFREWYPAHEYECEPRQRQART